MHEISMIMFIWNLKKSHYALCTCSYMQMHVFCIREKQTCFELVRTSSRAVILCTYSCTQDQVRLSQLARIIELLQGGAGFVTTGSYAIHVPYFAWNLQDISAIAVLYFWYHDGAPAHTARATRPLLQASRFNILPWSSCSLDLNPIWSVIGGKMRARDPRNVGELERAVLED